MKTVVVFSGGIDSATLLKNRLNEGHEVKVLHLSHNARYTGQEYRAVTNICREFGMNEKGDIVFMEFDISKHFKSSLLVGGSDIPKEEYDMNKAEETVTSTIIPFRNGIILSIAAGYANSIGYRKVVIASHKGDHKFYPDCSPGFNVAMRQAVSQGTGFEVSIQAPFQDLTKAQIIRLGAIYKIPYQLTWSCYEGGSIQCGICGSCRERRKAFEEAGVQDNTKYSLNP